MSSHHSAVRLALLWASLSGSIVVAEQPSEQHLLYVAVPGIRNDVSYGGEGILVFDIDHGHKWLKRISTHSAERRQPEAIKGICANAETRRLYFSEPNRLVCLDLVTEGIVWSRSYDSGCDRMSMTPDGKRLYLPSGDWTASDYWYLIDGKSGGAITKIHHKAGSHNTVCSLDGSRVHLASLKCNELAVVDTRTNDVIERIGPFTNSIRPFTVNIDRSLCFVTVNDLLGFEVGDLRSGKMVQRVEVPDYKKGPTKRHGCPSHGVGLTPDEKEIWVADATNTRLHIFDATVMPPKYVQSIKLSDEPGWVTFTIDGRYAYPSTGDVIDVKSRQIICRLTDEHGRPVQSEKLLEIDWVDGAPVRTGDQFGLGRSKNRSLTKKSSNAITPASDERLPH